MRLACAMQRRNRRAALRFLLCLVISVASARHGWAGTNLAHNGNFSVGSGNSVDGWRTDAWIQSPGTTDYQWIRPDHGAAGEVEVLTHHDNDARWLQPVSLTAGWYHISAEVKTRDVLTFFTGANVSVLEDGIISEDLRGDHDWTRIGLYLKIGPHGADVDVCLRLGGYANLTRGDAFFRDASIERVAAPPAGNPYTYDLDAIRKKEVTGPIGQPWTLVATLLLLLAFAGLGWRLMAEPAVAIAKATPLPQRAKKSKARGR